jgi:hypothetical protein
MAVYPRISLADYGVTGLGVTNDSPAVQQACLDAVAHGGLLYIPAADVGYRLDTPINLTNLDGTLTLVGHGINAPTFGKAQVPAVGGSLFLANTGTGRPAFDCCGSNNIQFCGLNVSSLGQLTPSTIGMLWGTSTTSPAVQAPGGANYGLENVAILLQNANESCPVYHAAGAGLCHLLNVWTLGVYGLVLTGSNALGVSSPFVTLGSNMGVDGVYGAGCTLLGYGGRSPLYLESAHNTTWVQTYIATILGGPSYAGQPYAIALKDCTATDMTVECDYFPSVATLQGSIKGLRLKGTTFPSTTPLPATAPLGVFFAGQSVVGSSFDLIATIAPNSHYWYTGDGVTATMALYNNCEFTYDYAISPNVFFGNVTAANTVPFFHLRFNGTQDGAQITVLRNGGAVATSAYRYWVNGTKFGTG